MKPYEPDYYCDAVELVKNSKLSDKDKKETLERMERVVLSPPYKIFSKDNFNYLKSKLEKLEKITMVTENYMEEQLKLQDELKEHAEITIRGMVKMLPPDVQTILYNAERLEGEKEWYKWRLEHARELLEKGEVMKAKEFLNQTDVDFKCFSELWEKAHQHVRQSH